jgi:prephenate dehydrogenase (NADP+)
LLGLVQYHADLGYPQAWSECVSSNSDPFGSYRDRFERIQEFFAERFPEAVRLGNEMIKTIMEKTTKEEVHIVNGRTG